MRASNQSLRPPSITSPGPISTCMHDRDGKAGHDEMNKVAGGLKGSHGSGRGGNRDWSWRSNSGLPGWANHHDDEKALSFASNGGRLKC